MNKTDSVIAQSPTARSAMKESSRTVSTTLSQFTFCLVDEIPGPSVGDAAELIEAFGMNPWAFITLDIISETTRDGIVTTHFAVTGPEPLVCALREAFVQQRVSN